MEFSTKNTGVGSQSLLQGIFPTQGLNLVSCTAGRFFTVWVTRNTQGASTLQEDSLPAEPQGKPLNCFHIWATVNNAVMNIGVIVSFLISTFYSFRYIYQEWNFWVIIAALFLHSLMAFNWTWSEHALHRYYHANDLHASRIFLQMFTWLTLCSNFLTLVSSSLQSWFKEETDQYPVSW